MVSLLTKINRRIRRILYIDLDQNYKNSILLAGTGRSGSTWVSGIINYKNEYRYIFEPFHPDKVRVARLFGTRRYIRPDNKNSNLLQAAKYILSGKIRNFWADNLNARFICTKRLIKCIRVNLFLRWLYENFPGLKIVFLIRHPCATALSHVRFGLKVSLNDYIQQDELVSDFLTPFLTGINKAKDLSDFEKHIFVWCIENYVPLKQFKSDEICVVFYENFCEKPEEEIKKMFSFLGMEYEDKVVEILKKPASLARKWSAVIKGENLINSWRNYVTNAEIKTANEILSLFGLNNLYDTNCVPNMEVLSGIMDRTKRKVLV